MIDSKILYQAVSDDFKDMHDMLNELEQCMLGVDPIRQMAHYRLILTKIFECLDDAQDITNVLLYPDETNQLPTILN